MDLFEEAARLERENSSFALATIIDAKGSAPRRDGIMLIRSDGSTIGTVGGGSLEYQVQQEAVEAIGTGEPRRVRRDLYGDESKGMECGGTVEVHIQVVQKKPPLLLIGGGHVNRAVAKAATLLGFDITVVENRRGFATPESFPEARSHFEDEDIRRALEGVEIAPETAAVIGTKGEDTIAAEVLLRSDAGYVGMLGSKRKVGVVIGHLREAGISEERIRQLHAPVGLDIGAETPAEIAVSVLAEILRHRNGGSGESMGGGGRPLVVLRGAGDIATGVAWRLHRSGFAVACLETANPTVIRRSVAFASALFEGSWEVEGVRAARVSDLGELRSAVRRREVAVLVDPAGESLSELRPVAVVDAILAKKNLGTNRGMAPITIALGPGFEAGVDVDAVVETNRGHNLGRVILEGFAEANTGVPGVVGGESSRRVVRAPGAGRFTSEAQIGDLVKEGDLLGRVGDKEVSSPLKGVLRGLIASKTEVTEGMKIGDVDPRGAAVDCSLISDKARAVAGGVLEALLYMQNVSREEQK